MPNSEHFRINDSRMPVSLGSALKVPYYAFPNWGIPQDAYYKMKGDELYACEWQGGTPQQMQYVVEAITRTGLGNFSQMLRDKNAEIVTHLVQNQFKGKRVNYIEPGAGVSTVNVAEKLLNAQVDMDRFHMTLIEPSAERLETNAAKLEKMGLRRNYHFHLHPGKKDTDMFWLVELGSQDIASNVAQGHHHPDIKPALVNIAAVLRQGGYYLSNDWHNSMWEHPNRVYEYLNTFEWETKDRDLEAFRQMYPQATQKAPVIEAAADNAANAMIMDFWRGWADVRAEAIRGGSFKPGDDILMLEGHRPVQRYIDDGLEVGLYNPWTSPTVTQLSEAGILKGNPMPLKEGSSILNTVVFEKS
jgi:SAM-dependent methyltransferase